MLNVQHQTCLGWVTTKLFLHFLRWIVPLKQVVCCSAGSAFCFLSFLFCKKSIYFWSSCCVTVVPPGWFHVLSAAGLWVCLLQNHGRETNSSGGPEDEGREKRQARRRNICYLPNCPLLLSAMTKQCGFTVAEWCTYWFNLVWLASVDAPFLAHWPCLHLQTHSPLQTSYTKTSVLIY